MDRCTDIYLFKSSFSYNYVKPSRVYVNQVGIALSRTAQVLVQDRESPGQQLKPC